MAKDYVRVVGDLLGHHQDIVKRLEITLGVLAAIDAAGPGTIAGALAAPLDVPADAGSKQPFLTVRRAGSAPPPPAAAKPAKKKQPVVKSHGASDGSRAFLDNGQSVKAGVLAFLKEVGEPMPPGRITTALAKRGAKPATVYAAITRLAEAHAIHKTPDRMYCLAVLKPPAGSAQGRVLETLARASMPIRAGQIIDTLALGDHAQSVYTALHKFKKEGVLLHHDNGTYSRGPNFPTNGHAG